MEKKKNIISRDECKKIQVQLLDAIAKICKKNSLNYYLAYGTLLGAIRHKGFIPWDDDIDIYLRRNDYEKLIDILKHDLCEKPDWLELIDGDTDGYYYPFAKVVNNTTIAKMEDNITKHGIWIDIFPEDVLPKSEFKQIMFVKGGKALRDVIIAMTTDFSKAKKNRKTFIKRLLCCIATIIGKKRVYNFTIRYYKRYENSNSSYYACMATPYGTREIAKSTELFTPTEVEFEGEILQSTVYWDKYLKRIYGNYMQLPSVENRKIHSITAWKIKNKLGEK